MSNPLLTRIVPKDDVIQFDENQTSEDKDSVRFKFERLRDLCSGREHMLIRKNGKIQQPTENNSAQQTRPYVVVTRDERSIFHSEMNADHLGNFYHAAKRLYETPGRSDPEMTSRFRSYCEHMINVVGRQQFMRVFNDPEVREFVANYSLIDDIRER